MSLTVQLLDRQFNPVILSATMQFDVQNYSHHVRGGPTTAQISVSGDEYAVWSLANMLRYAVEIRNERGQMVWWGFISDISIGIGLASVGYSLDRMNNRVKCVYSYVEPGTTGSGVRRTTGWVQNDNSVGQFGYKELIQSLSNATDAQANATANNVLAAQANPLPTVAFGNGDKLSATINCDGWYAALGWRYYANLSGYESHKIEPDADLAKILVGYYDDPGVVGTTQVVSYAVPYEDNTSNLPGSEMLAQSFKLAGSVVHQLTQVKIKAVRIGAPTDNLVCDICTNNAGLPGTVLASTAIASGTLNPAHSWVTISLSQRPWLKPNTSYWLVFKRSGTSDASNYPRITHKSGNGYVDGNAWYWNGSSWIDLNADLLFEISAEPGETGVNVGETSAITELAQSFTVAATQAVAINQIKLRVFAVGSMAGNVILDVCRDNAGVPNTTNPVASVSLVASVLNGNASFQTFTFDALAWVQPNTPYWLRIRRDVSPDANNYLRVSVNTNAGYAGGVCRIWNGSAWVASTPAGDALFEITSNPGKTAVDIGARTAQTHVAQLFVINGVQPYSVAQAKFFLQRVNNPTDNLICEVRSNNAGVPGSSVISSATVAASTLKNSAEWVTFVFSTLPTLNVGSVYWLVLRRSNANDPVHFVRAVISPDTQTATNGALWNGGAWSTIIEALLFEVGGAQSTTEQIRTIATNTNQFFTGIDVDFDSGIMSNQYRDGDNTAQICVEELLDAGTSDGRRINARVTSERRLVIEREPLLDDYANLLDRAGNLTTILNAPTDKTACPVNVWARLRDIPAAANLGGFAAFIEAATYAPREDKLTLRARANKNMYEIGKLQQG